MVNRLTNQEKLRLKLREKGKSLSSSDKDIFNALKGTVASKGLFRLAMKTKYSK